MNDDTMGPIRHQARTLTDHVLDQVRGWPALRVCQAECGTGRALAVGARQIVHFPSENEAEVYLTGPVVHRMREVLLRCGPVLPEPPGPWIRLRLGGDSDAELLISLISVAIKANTAAGELHRGAHACPRAMLRRLEGRPPRAAQ
ncbi:luciferase domain-containing protein [Thermomonospora amylolytica]|uniref:luciferase domain-containing protein n=1 Tax=Thermomonospora amylolytica TaxID=1411117 RepID=UPI0013003056|nr:luciferase family protein [Thermomonospora amylolytica]